MYKKFSYLLLGFMLSGCAAMTPTKESEVRYAIYDVKPKPGVSPSTITTAIKVALQKHMSGVQLQSMIPPSPLPKEPGRFKVINPFQGSMSGFAALAGQGLQFPTCDNASLIATAKLDSFKQYGQDTRFFLCLLPYAGGYNIDIYTSFTKLSGSLSPEVLGATLASKVMGDSSKFIQPTINDIIKEVEATGSKTHLVDAYL